MEVDKKWIIILSAYALLLCSMGYIAFYQMSYNPVTAIGPEELDLLSNENSKELIEQALREEGKAFQMKRDLAIQSFNIILGAVLGFLSATAGVIKNGTEHSKENKLEDISSNSSEVLPS